jgi:hypothetical protein
MSSSEHGTPSSGPEVSNISSHGFWLLAGGGEYFLSFKDFPWFKEAPVGKILNIEEASPGHFHWPDLDIDLSLDIIQEPERYPLVAR